MKQNYLIPALIACGLVIGGYYVHLFMTPKAPFPPKAHPESEQQHHSEGTSEQHAPADPQTSAESTNIEQQTPDASWNGADFAQVLADTQIDGALAADENGNLIVSQDVKDFFDYFMSAVGEVAPEQAIEEIRRQAQLRLTEPAASQVMELLADYVTYQHLMQDFMQQPLVPANQQDYEYYANTLRLGLQQIKNLRRQIFSPEAVEAFFGLDEAYSEYAVATMQVKADSDLSNEQKEAKLEMLKTLLPEQMRIADKDSRERAKVIQAAREVWDKEQNDAAVRELLGKQLPDDTVESTLDHFRKETEWSTKLQAYLEQRKALNALRLSEQAKQAQIELLRQEAFPKPEERLRAEAHERIEAEDARIALLTSESE